jgi:hypothetical protein
MRKKDSAMQSDILVKFTSHLGNSFIAPSQWTATDKGDTLSLRSSDGQASIHSIMYTSEGSGSFQEFREKLVSGLLPETASAWKPSNWTSIKLGERNAQKRDLIPVPESDHRWRLYVLDVGEFYHAIVFNASDVVMTLNGDFYEDIVRTFEVVQS